MTDKEIIIDGVNVAGCYSYKKVWGNDYNYCQIHHNSCHKSSGCYYKQLQRKELEYQKLSIKYLDMNSILDDALINLSDVGKPQHTLCELPFEIKKLKQECEKLRGTLNKRKEEIKNLNYVLYEERELSLDLGKANLKIAKLERDISSHKNRFKYEIDKSRKELSSLLAEKNALEIGRYEYRKQSDNILDECIRYQEKINKLEKENDRYKQAVEKIEDIAKSHTSVHCLDPDCDCNNCHDEITENGKTCINKGRLEILTIINEVKNAR